MTVTDGSVVVTAGSMIITGADPTGAVPIAFSDNRGIADAFGRMRVSDPVTLFDSQLQYDSGSLLWDSLLVNGASTAHVPNESAQRLSIGTGASDRAVRQTWEYFRYQPGKSQLVFLTGNIGNGQADTEQCMGYYDDDNGVFLQNTNGSPAIVLRSSVTGSAVDDVKTQSEWNVDKVDGSGSSLKNIDIDKAQIFFLDLEWLAVGRVRAGFVIDGALVYAHQFLNANNVTTAYMSTANLPVRYELKNTAATGAGASMLQICAAVISEGGFEDQRGLPFSAGNGTTEIAVTNRRPVLSIRPKPTFEGKITRGKIDLSTISARARTNDALIEIVYGGTLTGASWNSADDNSIVEYDVTATDITGGMVVDSFHAVEGAGNNANATLQEQTTRLPIAHDISGSNPRTITVMATSFAATSNLATTGTWKEQR